MPHSFVMHRGDVGKSVLQLEMDIRNVMEPYTATKLKVITWIPCDLLCASVDLVPLLSEFTVTSLGTVHSL